MANNKKQMMPPSLWGSFIVACSLFGLLLSYHIDARRSPRKKNPYKIVDSAMGETDSAPPSKAPQAPSTPKQNSIDPDAPVLTGKTVSIKYDDRDLVDFINSMAALKEINIVLPLGTNAIKEKLTLSIDRPLSVDEAWQLLHAVLSMADYKMVQHENLFEVLKSGKETGKETAKSAVKHLYVNTPKTDLPDTDELIRYVYHLENIRLPSEGRSEIEGILKEILPIDKTVFKVDPGSNSVLLAAPARTVRATIDIIAALDVVGFQEKMEFVQLHHSSASTVATILNELRQTNTTDDMGYRPEPRKKSDTGYFSKHVRIVPYEPLNSLLVVGRGQDVERIKEFIQKSIDITLESGDSIIHTKELQYLKADDFEKVLERVVRSARSGGTEQSKAAKGGPDTLFDDVIIRADRPADPEKSKSFGSNTLIVVARKKDWIHIEALINELDQPQPQVLLEVLIADLTMDDVRRLGGMMRNPAKIPLPGGVNFQSASLNPGVIADGVVGAAKTIGVLEAPKATADLLGASPAPGHDNSTPTSPAIVRTSGQGGAGTTISLNDDDGKTWSILHLLKVFSHTKILSHPHLIALDNEEATFELGETRRVPGEVLQADNNSNFRKEPPIEAKTIVKITPRIGRSTMAGGEQVLEPIVNLKVEINIDEFKSTSTSNNTRIQRKVETSTNVQDNAILALGGLVKTDSTQSSKKTPILGDMPILGWFFKQRQGEGKKSCLTVFIRPTIVNPKNQERMRRATQDYIHVARHHAGEAALFDTLRDPITHWFFRKEDAGKAIDQFVSKDDGPKNSSEEKADTGGYPPKNNSPDWNALRDQLQQESNPLAQATKRHKKMTPTTVRA